MITVKLAVPDTAWTIAIDQVYQVKNELWVFSTVSRDPNVIGAQVILTVKAVVKVEAPPNLPVKHFVLGYPWNVKNTESYTFLKDLKTIEKKLKTAKLLYDKSKK